jgi:hypothetical protein
MMTKETRTTIELRDIRYVEFECASCHTKLVYPIDKFNHPIFVCNVCPGAKVLIPERGRETDEIKQLINLINRFSGKPEGYIMRFDISGSEGPEGPNANP